MANYWMIPRPKRKLLSLVDVLASFSEIILNQAWEGRLDSQLEFEAALERGGLKALGARRDRQAGGARTYEAWLASLGLIFRDSSGLQRLTLAGEALLNGEPPVPLLTGQLIKFQYPSAYSLRTQVEIDRRFKVHPFWLLLKLMADPRLGYVTESEIARFVVTEGVSDRAVDQLVASILSYRQQGDAVLAPDFADRYPPKGGVPQSLERTLKRLKDVANTFVNFLEYTQLIVREGESAAVDPEAVARVNQIVGEPVPFIERAEETETFQRRFGLDLKRRKDTRRFDAVSVTASQYAERLVLNEFLRMASERPIVRITEMVIETVAERSGVPKRSVGEALRRFPDGSLSAFEATYLDMSRAGREDATEFELATLQIFGPDGLGFTAAHVGPRPLHPDILLISRAANCSAIIDAKAYVKYSIANDHKNRMLVNYLPTYRAMAARGEIPPLRFWGYVTGGMRDTVGSVLADMGAAAKIPGFAMTARGLLNLLRGHLLTPLTPEALLALFTSGGVISPSVPDESGRR